MLHVGLWQQRISRQDDLVLHLVMNQYSDDACNCNYHGGRKPYATNEINWTAGSFYFTGPIAVEIVSFYTNCNLNQSFSGK